MMAARKQCALCLSLLVAACSANNEARDAARAQVTATLKDPGSAQFRNEAMKGHVLCGEINAKNSMGGYVGFSRFIGTPTQHALEGKPLANWHQVDPGMVAASLAAEERLLTAKGLTGASVFQLPQKEIQEARDAAKFAHLWGLHC